jgi:hypothetical protein
VLAAVFHLPTRGGRARFLNQVDPDRKLPEDERERWAASAKKAYMAGLALKSVAGRRMAAEARKKANKIEREAAEADHGVWP